MAAMVSRQARAGHAAMRPTALREYSVHGCKAVVLESEAEMREEWAAMRNCLLDFIGACIRGTHRAISLRDRETGERMATVIVQKEGGRHVALDARRRFNRPAGPALWAAAQRAAAIYGGAVEARTPGRASLCRRAKRPEWPAIGERPPVGQTAFDFGAA